MKIGITTDIHSNISTLNIVLNRFFRMSYKSNIANAGILEINKNEICYKQLKIEYNVNEVIQEIERLKFPFYKGILKIFYGKE